MKDILVVQGDWNAKVDKEAIEHWQAICGPFCNDDTNETGLRLLEFATFNDLVLANTFGHHITKHPEDGPSIAQIDNTTTRLIIVLVRKCFRSGVNSARTRTFPGPRLADDGLPPSSKKNQQAKPYKT